MKRYGWLVAVALAVSMALLGSVCIGEQNTTVTSMADKLGPGWSTADLAKWLVGSTQQEFNAGIDYMLGLYGDAGYDDLDSFLAWLIAGAADTLTPEETETIKVMTKEYIMCRLVTDHDMTEQQRRALNLWLDARHEEMEAAEQARSAAVETESDEEPDADAGESLEEVMERELGPSGEQPEDTIGEEEVAQLAEFFVALGGRSVNVLAEAMGRKFGGETGLGQYRTEPSSQRVGKSGIIAP